jgi:hypothetical protein
VARDPSATVQAAWRQVRRAKRSSGRLFIAGLGFSVAYFFDGAQGRARRKQVVDMVRRVRRSKAAIETAHSAPELPRIGRSDVGPRATFQRAADGIDVTSRVSSDA